MTALQTLLAVARRGYTTAAAESMNLSQSAVSKQLLALEDLIGGPAFERTAHGMVPTEAGRIYIEKARMAIKAMEDAKLQVARLKPDPQALRIQVLPILGDRWLLPRFATFSEQYPQIDVQFTNFSALTQTESPDAVFTFGTEPPAGDNGIYLFGHEVLLVAAPAYWERLGAPQTLEEMTAGIMLEHPDTPLHWSDFVTTLGKPEVQPERITQFGYYTMVIRAALAGQGMTLIPRGLIIDDLESGRLINPAGLGYQSRYGYWFSIPRSNMGNPVLQTFLVWLRATLQADPE